MSQRIAIVTDSAADIPPDLVEHYHIEVVSHKLTMGTQSWWDGFDIEPSGFYDVLRESADFPIITPPDLNDFQELFTKLSQEFEAILLIGGTESFRTTARLPAAREVAANLSDISIEILDSQGISMMTGFAVLAAAQAAIEGQDIQEIIAAARYVIEKSQMYVIADGLEYLHRSGRVGKAATVIGTFLKLKPMLSFAKNETTVVGITLGKEQAFEKLDNLLKEQYSRGTTVRAAIVSMAANQEDVAQLNISLAKHVQPIEIIETEGSPAWGSIVGPGSIGLVLCQETRPHQTTLYSSFQSQQSVPCTQAAYAQNTMTPEHTPETTKLVKQVKTLKGILAILAIGFLILATILVFVIVSFSDRSSPTKEIPLSDEIEIDHIEIPEMMVESESPLIEELREMPEPGPGLEVISELEEGIPPVSLAEAPSDLEGEIPVEVRPDITSGWFDNQNIWHPEAPMPQAPLYPPNAVAPIYNPDVFFVKANQLLFQQQYAELIALGEEQLQKTPENQVVYHYLGKAFFSMGNYQKAIDHFSKAGEIASRAMYAYDIGMAYFMLDDFTNAIPYLLTAYEQFPNDPYKCYNLGITYYHIKDYENALTYLIKAQNLMPSWETTYTGPLIEAARQASGSKGAGNQSTP